ncbi:MAG: GAF domain-containing protein [Myxococcales bacterium]|nr:GAF domain-containing protein [Myxococcales bacterium]
MSEGIFFSSPAPRDALMPEVARLARLDEALPQIEAVLATETDAVAIEATLACLLWDTLAHVNFCGFYRRIGATTLAVGPYQGSMGCLRIDFGRGVCGAAARTREVQIVDDVHAFPGHIACDSRSRSELVIPVVAGGELRAVLDVDSPFPAAFGRAEADRIEALVARTLGRAGVVF